MRLFRREADLSDASLDTPTHLSQQIYTVTASIVCAEYYLQFCQRLSHLLEPRWTFDSFPP